MTARFGETTMMIRSFTFLILACIVFMTSAVSWASTISYKYDDAGRLLQAIYPGLSKIKYSYDNSGNLLTRTVELPIPGDVSGSRKVEMADAILLLQYAAELTELSLEQKQIANITGHQDLDNVGVPDAIIILRFMAGDR